MLTRDLTATVKTAFTHYPVVTLIGPRQSGKSTLAKMCFPQLPYVDLEDLKVQRLVVTDPRGFLQQYRQGAIFSEIQNVPELLSYIQVEVDERQENGLYVLTGSHQLSLHAAITQSLVGRTAMLTLWPLSLHELAQHHDTLSADEAIFYGGFPRLTQAGLDPHRMYSDYYQTYIQRDVRQMMHLKDMSLFNKFVKLCAGRIGSIFNAHALANEVGVSSHTINSWLSVLEASFIMFRLPPYFENFGKRVIKSPKVYFTDVGLACYLLDIENIQQLSRDPLRGALFENLVVLECMKYRLNQGKQPNSYFYRDHHGHEVDLVMKYGHQLLPIEIKSAETFHEGFLKHLKYYAKITEGRCQRGCLVYGGSQSASIGDVEVINFQAVHGFLQQVL